jgi:hypothetical protein
LGKGPSAALVLPEGRAGMRVSVLSLPQRHQYARPLGRWGEDLAKPFLAELRGPCGYAIHPLTGAAEGVEMVE